MESAVGRLYRCLDICDAFSCEKGETLITLGALYMDLNDYEAAKKVCEEAMEQFIEANKRDRNSTNGRLIATCCYNIGQCQLELGEPGKAAQQFSAGMIHLRKMVVEPSDVLLKLLEKSYKEALQEARFKDKGPKVSTETDYTGYKKPKEDFNCRGHSKDNLKTIYFNRTMNLSACTKETLNTNKDIRKHQKNHLSANQTKLSYFAGSDSKAQFASYMPIRTITKKQREYSETIESDKLKANVKELVESWKESAKAELSIKTSQSVLYIHKKPSKVDKEQHPPTHIKHLSHTPSEAKVANKRPNSAITTLQKGSPNSYIISKRPSLKKHLPSPRAIKESSSHRHSSQKSELSNLPQSVRDSRSGTIKEDSQVTERINLQTEESNPELALPSKRKSTSRRATQTADLRLKKEKAARTIQRFFQQLKYSTGAQITRFRKKFPTAKWISTAFVKLKKERLKAFRLIPCKLMVYHNKQSFLVDVLPVHTMRSLQPLIVPKAINILADQSLIRLDSYGKPFLSLEDKNSSKFAQIPTSSEVVQKPLEQQLPATIPKKEINQSHQIESHQKDYKTPQMDLSNRIPDLEVLELKKELKDQTKAVEEMKKQLEEVILELKTKSEQKKDTLSNAVLVKDTNEISVNKYLIEERKRICASWMKQTIETTCYKKLIIYEMVRISCLLLEISYEKTNFKPRRKLTRPAITITAAKIDQTVTEGISLNPISPPKADKNSLSFSSPDTLPIETLKREDKLDMSKLDMEKSFERQELPSTIKEVTREEVQLTVPPDLPFIGKEEYKEEIHKNKVEDMIINLAAEETLYNQEIAMKMYKDRLCIEEEKGSKSHQGYGSSLQNGILSPGDVQLPTTLAQITTPDSENRREIGRVRMSPSIKKEICASVDRSDLDPIEATRKMDDDSEEKYQRLAWQEVSELESKVFEEYQNSELARDKEHENIGTTTILAQAQQSEEKLSFENPNISHSERSEDSISENSEINHSSKGRSSPVPVFGKKASREDSQEQISVRVDQISEDSAQDVEKNQIISGAQEWKDGILILKHNFSFGVGNNEKRGDMEEVKNQVKPSPFKSSPVAHSVKNQENDVLSQTSHFSEHRPQVLPAAKQQLDDSVSHKSLLSVDRNAKNLSGPALKLEIPGSKISDKIKRRSLKVFESISMDTVQVSKLTPEEFAADIEHIQNYKVGLYIRYFNIDVSNYTPELVEKVEDFFGTQHPVLSAFEVDDRLPQSKFKKCPDKDLFFAARKFVTEKCYWKNIIDQSTYNKIKNVLGEILDTDLSVTFDSFKSEKEEQKANLVESATKLSALIAEIEGQLNEETTSNSNLLEKYRKMGSQRDAIKFSKNSKGPKLKRNKKPQFKLLMTQFKDSIYPSTKFLFHTMKTYYDKKAASDTRDAEHFRKMAKKIEAKLRTLEKAETAKITKNQMIMNERLKEVGDSEVGSEYMREDEVRIFNTNKNYLVKNLDRPLHELPILKSFSVQNFTGNSFSIKIRVTPTSPQQFYVVESWSSSDLFLEGKAFAESVFDSPQDSELSKTEKINRILSLLLRSLTFEINQALVHKYPEGIPDFNMELGYKRKCIPSQDPLVSSVF